VLREDDEIIHSIERNFDGPESLESIDDELRKEMRKRGIPYVINLDKKR